MSDIAEEEELPPMQKLNPLSFEILVEQNKFQTNGLNLNTLFNIEITHREQTTWIVEKSFNEFESLHQKFVNLFKDVPFFPSKSIFDSKEPSKSIRAYLKVNQFLTSSSALKQAGF